MRHQALLRAAGRPTLTEEQVTAEVLRRVARYVHRLCGRTLDAFGLPVPPPDAVPGADVEPDVDVQQLLEDVADNELRLTADQRAVYDEVLQRLENGEGGAIFVQAAGGSGKTFLENLLLAKVRSQGHEAIAVASSGIAACLLDGGTTAHHRFKIPIRLQEGTNSCYISKRSPEAALLQRCRLIVWDEAAMMNRRAVEAVDVTLQDIRDSQQVFGGVLTVLSGDWRQILPVVKKGGRAQVVRASLKKSPLWRDITVLELHTNMRAHLHGDQRAGEFAAFLLRVGNGELPALGEIGPDTIAVPEEIRSPARDVGELATRVFPDIQVNYRDPDWLRQRAIITTLNADVDAVNGLIMERLPGEAHTYHSVDSMADPEAVPMQVEVLNTIQMSGLPQHTLILKVSS